MSDIIRNYARTSNIKPLPRPGRPRITTQADNQRIKLISKRNRRLTAPEIAAEMNRDRERPISVTTVKRRLREANLHGRVAVRKPLLRRGNRQKRLHWARTHRNWTVDDFKNVLWTDESKFEVFGQTRRVFVRRSKGERMLPECIVPTVKQGKSSVLVWGCFSNAGTGDLVQINGIMKKENYLKILQDNAIPSGVRLIGNNFVFMHDNDPKHTAIICKNFLNGKQEDNILKIMDWPPQSPDLNPIELLWDELDRRVRKVCPTSKTNLWNIIQDQWTNMPHMILEKLIERMPRVVKAVLNSKGGFFDEKKI